MLEAPRGGTSQGMQCGVIHDPDNLWVNKPNTQEKIAESDGRTSGSRIFRTQGSGIARNPTWIRDTCAWLPVQGSTT
jgi:hypothetical protein